MRFYCSMAVISALLALILGCGRSPQLGPRLQAAGGAAVLKQECAGFIKLFEDTKEQQYAWKSGDTNFPPTIAKLQPQILLVERQNGVLMVDMRLSGGFIHHGLLVVTSTNVSGFVPRRSSWDVWKLADGVFEYRE